MSSANGVASVSRSASVPADSDDLRAELETLRDDLKSLVSTAQAVLKTKSDDGVERGREVVSEASAKASEVNDMVQDAVRKNPLMAIGCAVGLGALLASIKSK